MEETRPLVCLPGKEWKCNSFCSLYIFYIT